MAITLYIHSTINMQMSKRSDRILRGAKSPKIMKITTLYSETSLINTFKIRAPLLSRDLGQTDYKHGRGEYHTAHM